MAYLLDTNTFIVAYNFHYGMDFCPGYWDWLKRENECGTVFSVAKVFQELCNQTDGLSNWAKTTGKPLFLKAESTPGSALVSVANHVQKLPTQFKQKHKDSFLAGADLQLVACAVAQKHTVVTLEKFIKPDPTYSQVKIPNVCAHYGVRCVTPYRMLRELGAGFSLMPKREYPDGNAQNPELLNPEDD